MADPLPIEELPSKLQPGARLLGFDLGTKTIGLALSDVTRAIATPYETLRRTKFTDDAKKIASIAAKEGVGGLVIGLPLNLDGSESPRAQSTRGGRLTQTSRRGRGPDGGGLHSAGRARPDESALARPDRQSFIWNSS
jgi:hypothetical protein